MQGIVFSMIIVRMVLSVAWQNGIQNSSFLTTIQYNRQLAMSAQPQGHFIQSIRISITAATVDESQSSAKIVAIK